MRNPYIIDSPLAADNLYYGRERSYARLDSYLAAGSPLLLLFGKRYWGKTSFLHQLAPRLGARYLLRHLEFELAEADPVGGAAQPLWWLAARMGEALGSRAPDRASFDRDPSVYLRDYLRSLRGPGDALPFLICLDAVPARWIAEREGWPEALIQFSKVLEEVGGLTVILAVEGHPVELGQTALPNLPQIQLDPLSEEEAEDLLITPVRGRMAYDYESIRRIHRLSGGHPFFLQLFGHILYEERVAMGWVGLPEVERLIDEVVVRGAAQFENFWETCTPPARIVLCCFAEMLGHHGMASSKDVLQYLNRLRVQMPPRDIEIALEELREQGLLEILGGDTYRFGSELFRVWLRGQHTVLEAARQSRRYKRARAHRFAPLANKRIDWFGLLLWAIAGVLVLLIAFVWRSRQGGTVWTGGLLGPQKAETSAPLGVSSKITITPLPTPEGGLVPGHIVYIAKAKLENKWAIYSMRADGSHIVQLTDGTSNDTGPAWSPDGKKIAFVSDRDGNREVYVMNADGSDPVNLTQNSDEDWTPTWSPDGKKIAFASFRDNNWEIYVMNADGSGVRRLTENGYADYSPAWSPDGTRIAFVSNRDGNLEIYVMDTNGNNPVRVTNNAATDQAPTWSPDGTQLLWESYRDGNMEIYTAKPDGSGLRNLSRDAYADDHGATWSPWGNQIAYFSNRNGGWDIYTLNLNTGERVNITSSDTIIEQAPNWGR